MPENVLVHPGLLRALCAARDLENARKHILPRACSTYMCYERLREHPTAHAFTPILFDLYVLQETVNMPANTRVYPDLVRAPCAARDLENARKRTRSPRSSSSSMCCERFRECPKTHFTPSLFDIYVLQEIYRRSQSRSVHPDLIRHLCCARDSEKASTQRRLPRVYSISMCFKRFRG